MRQLYVLILFLLTTQMGIAQQTTYTHDVSGNRIKRLWEPALPVTLISFTATKSNGNSEHPAALLKWRTASETNSDHFAIQRSGDGKKWQEIGSVQASGDKVSDTDYSFVDEAVMDGENVYRLKMIDRDQTFAYSSIRSLDFRSLIVFYPNPVNARLRIKGLHPTEAKTSKVQIWDAAGRLVRQSTGVPTEGIDMSMLPTGIYAVNIIQSNSPVIIRKVVKE